MKDNNGSALILGATGGIGSAIAAALLRHGWQVYGFARSTTVAACVDHPGMHWIRGDAMNRRAVERAAMGMDMLVHAVNPPGYRNWDRLVLPMIDNTIAAARAAGSARIVLPGTIYNFNPAQTPLIDANTPQHPTSRKGKIRVTLEKRLAVAAPDVPSLVVRAGDFFGPGARSSWFSQAMLKPGKAVTRIVNPARGSGHSWAYLPDLAETFARLMDAKDRLASFERVQFQGLYDANGSTLIHALQQILGHTPRVKPFPWWLMHVLAPFGGFPREASELAPYWRHPVKLDNTRLVDLIGPEPHTALETALRTSFADMHCLSDYGGPGQSYPAHDSNG